MSDNNPWDNDKYDPEADRCCKDCGKTYKTKEGVLHGKYDFHCSTCHMWWKKTWQKIYWGIGITAVILITLTLVFLWKYLSKEDKAKKKKRFKIKSRSDDYEIEEDDDDD